MNKVPRRLLKVLLGILIAVIIFVVVVIIFISPISKYIIEKYDHQILGRKIRMSWIYVNPFTGYAHISGLKIYENEKDTVLVQKDSLFFGADGVSVNFALLKMLKKTYEISSLTVTRPWGHVVQNRQDFNFMDIIQHFAPKDTTAKPVTNSEPTHFNILKVAIKDGEFHYDAQSIPVKYYIKNVNIETPGKWWNVDSMTVKFALASGPSAGTINGDFAINFDSLEYRLNVKIDTFDLKLLEQYLHGFTTYGNFDANLDADLHAGGNLGSKLAVEANGYLAVNDFHFGKRKGDDFASFDKLVVTMRDVDPRNFEYYFDTIMLKHPFFEYDRYDYLDNLQRMFGKGGQNYANAKADSTKFNLIVLIANYIQDLAKNFAKSYYQANKVAIYNGDFRFADYSLREKFGVAAKQLTVITDTIDRHKERMTVKMNSNVKPYGGIAVGLSIDPDDYTYFDLDYHLLKLPVAMFNPYVLTYTSFPLDRGTLEFNGFMHVDSGRINSDNHIIIVDPRVGKRIKKSDTKWIPVPLIMSIVREAGDGMDYDVPIKGDLTKPKFKIWPIVLDIVKNIFVKPPSTPYLAHVKTVERQVEKLLTLKWETRQVELKPGQAKFVGKVADFLKKTPEASISVVPLEFSDKEKEYVMFFEAKKKYFLTEHKIAAKNFTADDSIEVERMSIKDSQFVHYMNRITKDTLTFTVQHQCIAYVGQKVLEAKFEELLAARKKEFMSYFVDEGVAKQVKMSASEFGVPYNGFSYYKIDYSGEFPPNLLKAYAEIDNLNNARPRGKFEKERKRVGGLLIENKELEKK